MLGRLVLRLGELGQAPPAEDYGALNTLLTAAQRQLLAQTGQMNLPEELAQVAVDMAAGEYMLFRRSGGLLEEPDQQYAVRQISQGDTSVTYAVADQLSPIDDLINRLITPPEDLIAKWRRMQW